MDLGTLLNETNTSTADTWMNPLLLSDPFHRHPLNPGRNKFTSLKFTTHGDREPYKAKTISDIEIYDISRIFLCVCGTSCR